MFSMRHVVILLAAGLISLSTIVAVTAQSARRARPTSVAVMDVEKVFNALDERTRIEADLKTRGERLQQEERERAEEIRKIQQDLEILVPGTSNYENKEGQLTQKAMELQVWRQFQNARLGRERAIQIENLYRKMTDSLARVAKDNGYDVVIFKEKGVDFPKDKPEQLLTVIQLRKVLWAADDLDISDQVITVMNNEFKATPR